MKDYVNYVIYIKKNSVVYNNEIWSWNKLKLFL